MKKGKTKRHRSPEEERAFKTQMIFGMDDIDTIVAHKMKKLNGYGLQKATTTLEGIYQLKKTKASDIEIFDKMAKLSWMLREYTSKIKGKQQKLLC